MTDTNAFNPAGFYGVAFEHLPDEMALAVVEGADVFAFSVGIIATLDFALTEPTDVMVSSALVAHLVDLAATEDTDVFAATLVSVTESILVATGAPDVAAITAQIIAVTDLAVTEGADVAAVSAEIIAFATLAVTEDTVDTCAGTAFVAHTFDMPLVEPKDVVEAELATTADLDLVATEAPDVATISTFAKTEMLLAAVENTDTIVMPAGRWDLIVEADDDRIRVAWEQQAVVVPGRPQGAVEKFHLYHTAFNDPGFYPNAFFTGTGAFSYSDDEAIVVPAPAVTERLRETRKSYVAPRRRV